MVGAEHRLPATIATLCAIALLWFSSETVQPNWVRIPVAVAASAMLLVLLAFNPARLGSQSPWRHGLSIALAAFLGSANIYALVSVVVIVLTTTPDDGRQVLLAATQIWVVNVVAFALLFWEIDRGGPVMRHRGTEDAQYRPDFVFPQDEIDRNITRAPDKGTGGRWQPRFVDYLYESATQAMTFGPGVAKALRPRTKLLILVETSAAFVLLGVLIAIAVGLLGS